MKRTSMLLLALVVHASPAQAQKAPEVEEAKQLFEAGKQAYRAGRYEVAARLFRQAYDLAPRAAIVFSEAQAYRLQYGIDEDPSRLQRSVALYKQYLELAPDGRRRSDALNQIAKLKLLLAELGYVEERGSGQAPSATELIISSPIDEALGSVDGAEAQPLPMILSTEPGSHTVKVEAPGYLSKEVRANAVAGRSVSLSVSLDPQPARVRVSAPDGASILLDGNLVGETPLARPLEIPAGRHRVTISSLGSYAFRRDVEAIRGGEVSVVADLEMTTQRTISYVFLGGGAALFAGSALTYLMALSRQTVPFQNQKDRDAGQIFTLEQAQKHNDLLDERDELGRISTAFFVGSLILGGTGVLLYFLDDPSTAKSEEGARIVPLITSEGVSAAVGGSF